MMRKDFDPGPLAEVSTDTSGPRPTIIFVRELRHAPDKVWEALTDPDQVSQWAPFTPNRSLASTGPAVLRMTDEGRTEESPAVVTRVEPPALLEYTWGEDRLVWLLEPNGHGGTRLTLRHTVEHPEWLPRVAAGWHICLVVAERLLDGRPIGPIVGREAKRHGWDALHDAYAAALGVRGAGFPAEKFPTP
jgi:uncharacterized protein YndB with AHSA1/START domain